MRSNKFSNKTLRLIQDTLAVRFGNPVETQQPDHKLAKNNATEANT